jgi:micrococcal nuclease
MLATLLCLGLAGCGNSDSYKQAETSVKSTQSARSAPSAPDLIVTPQARNSPTASLADEVPGDTAVVRLSLPFEASEQATVTKIVDGDTIYVTYAEGSSERVRLLAIDAPEATACFGDDSRAGLASLVPVGSTIWLQREGRDRDKYDRLLRHAWYFGRGKYRLLEYELVRQGLALSHDYGDRSLYTGKVERAMEEAEASGTGYWGACGSANSMSAPTTAAALGVRNLDNCSPAYPDACLPPGPPDLDCGEVSVRGFAVLPPDPHNFDRDHDGIGCERG